VQITSKLNHLGGTLDPHCAFLLQRSIKTLGVRVRQQNANALALATFLEQQPQVRVQGSVSGLELKPGTQTRDPATFLEHQPQVRGFRVKCQDCGRLRTGSRQRSQDSSRR